MNNYTSKETKKQVSKDVLGKCTDKRLKNPKFSDYIKPFLTDRMNLLVKDCGTFL